MKTLKKLRIDAGLSQFDLGRKIRIHPSLISKLESGVIRPWPGIIKKLERIFGRPMQELLRDDSVSGGGLDA